LGEEVISAGQRRLREEMSINLPLKYLGSFQYKAKFNNGLIEHELDHVLLGKWDFLQSVIPNPMEVQDFRWLTLEKLQEESNLNPENYTPWFKPALNLVLGKF
jgi:isopentenyl-diphosphate delta-isomerase